MEFLIYILLGSLRGLLLFNFFKAADVPVWKAFIPIYNVFMLIKIIERPWWWIILATLPVIGFVMNVVIIFEFLHVYGFRKIWQTIAAIFTAGLYLGYLNISETIKYVGRDDRSIKNQLGDWGNSIVFAIVAATIIRATTFEAYTIPTSSMEKSLMVGDFLFVSKFHYGIRPPMTVISFPLIHNAFPMTTIKSYLDWPQIPYFRLPGIQDVKRGEAVVFNYPVDMGPIDKRMNYIKRCVGIPGDDIEVRDRVLYVNGEEFQFPDRANPQYKYFVKTNGRSFNKEQLKRDFDINFLNNREFKRDPSSQDVYSLQSGPNDYLIFISDSALKKFSQLPNVVEIEKIIAPEAGGTSDRDIPEIVKLIGYGDTTSRLFPDAGIHSAREFKYSWDNYGPIHVPAEGDVIELNPRSILQYATLIEKYEGNVLALRDGKYFINGEETSTYTVQQNYYWMMGDNRHNSQDSRYWGYVPEDHIVGKPVFIWMSWDKNGTGLNKIRTDRVFTTVHGQGNRVSYFWYCVVVGFLIYFGTRFIKKRKATNA